MAQHTSKTHSATPVVPEYFQITDNYEKLRVGHISSPTTLVETMGYDYYILAGNIGDNHLFSRLVMQNMDVHSGCAIDTNLRVNHQYPNNMKFLMKNVSYKQDEVNENLGYFCEKYSSMFLKMDIKGEEYLWVLSQSPDMLSKFKQMVITFHEINQNPTEQRAKNKIKCLTKLKETHNIAFLKYNGLDLTITYIRKDHTPEFVSSEKIDKKKRDKDRQQQEVVETTSFKKEEPSSRALTQQMVNEADAKAKEEADAKAKEEADAKAKADADAKAKADADAKAKADADAKANADADAKAKEEADAKAKEEADAKAKEEADAKAKADADANAKEEADAKAKADAEAKVQAEIAAAEAIMKAEIAAAEQELKSAALFVEPDNASIVNEKIGMELTIQETSDNENDNENTIDLELDEASSDDEEEERERERLKQLSISKKQK